MNDFRRHLTEIFHNPIIQDTVDDMFRSKEVIEINREDLEFMFVQLTAFMLEMMYGE